MCCMYLLCTLRQIQSSREVKTKIRLVSESIYIFKTIANSYKDQLQMSRFIPEGKSDLKSQQQQEKDAYRKFQEEQQDKEHMSLYEQMRLNYLEKEREYEDKVRARNQRSKLTESELEYYRKLDAERDEKEKSKKRAIDAELEKFDELKKQRVNNSSGNVEPKKDTVILPTKVSIKGIKKATVTTTTTPVKQEKIQNSEKEIPKEDPIVKPSATGPSSLVSGYSSGSGSDSSDSE